MDRAPVLAQVRKQLVVTAADDVRRAEPEVAAPAPAAGQVAHLAIEHRDLGTGVLEQDTQVFLHRRPLGFGPLAVGDVARDADQTLHRTGRVDQRPLHREPGVAAAMDRQGLLGHLGRATEHDLAIAGAQGGCRFGAEQRHVVPPEHLAHRLADRARAGVVDQHVAAFEVLDEDGVRSALHHRAQQGAGALQLGLRAAFGGHVEHADDDELALAVRLGDQGGGEPHALRLGGADHAHVEFDVEDAFAAHGARDRPLLDRHRSAAGFGDHELTRHVVEAAAQRVAVGEAEHGERRRIPIEHVARLVEQHDAGGEPVEGAAEPGGVRGRRRMLGPLSCVGALVRRRLARRSRRLGAEEQRAAHQRHEPQLRDVARDDAVPVSGLERGGHRDARSERADPSRPAASSRRKADHQQQREGRHVGQK